jgi:DNA-binding response OmpR family regulator
MATILIADDEPTIVLAVRDELAFEGFEVHAAADGLEAVERARALRPDVLLLDVMLPGLNGFEVCRRLRAEIADLWVIMLSARGQEADRVTGFEAGADDYVTKPFSLRELVGRVKVAIRRRQGRTAAPVSRLGDLLVDGAARRVTRHGAEIPLTRREFDILDLLIQRAGEVVTRDEFLDRVWGKDVYVTHRTVDTHVAALRKKIEGPDGRELIQSVRGVGYRLDTL